MSFCSLCSPEFTTPRMLFVAANNVSSLNKGNIVQKVWITAPESILFSAIPAKEVVFASISTKFSVIVSGNGAVSNFSHSNYNTLHAGDSKRKVRSCFQRVNCLTRSFFHFQKEVLMPPPRPRSLPGFEENRLVNGHTTTTPHGHAHIIGNIMLVSFLKCFYAH